MACLLASRRNMLLEEAAGQPQAYSKDGTPLPSDVKVIVPPAE